MPGNIKVLLVDDNPMVLEMLRQALAQFSSVSTLTDGADAMLRAIDDKPDLIISITPCRRSTASNSCRS